MNPGILITVMLVGALVAGLVASNKGRSAAAWGLFGAFFPLIALIIVVCLPSAHEPSAP
jgi:hypothetical protein